VKLVLFDIDGTLLRSEGLGRASMRSALAEVFGAAGDETYRYDGKTDKQIVRELMRLEGHSDDAIDERMERLIARYVGGLDERIAAGNYAVRMLPGVPELLDELEQQDGIALGLLTGNVAEGARRKLAAAGLGFDRFRVNAFGSDEEHRPNLPAVAQQRASETLGIELERGAMIVVGDTPADIACGRALGAKAIGVATGHYSVDDLREHQPYAVFADLSDTAAVLKVILDA
jgi:phosphoglycolate phosphatase-like HAD superfamily hydrolase